MGTMPSITTIAGRHAADRRRSSEALRQAEQDLLQDLARNDLARAFRRRGLVTHTHFEPELGNERALWVDCRLESRQADHELIYAILDERDWHTDRRRLSRINARYDVLRLEHAPSLAKVALIVKIPAGGVIEWEAA